MIIQKCKLQKVAGGWNFKAINRISSIEDRGLMHYV